MRKATLVLAVFSICLLLATPTLAWEAFYLHLADSYWVKKDLAWETFYLTPSDPHFIKIEDPAGRLTDEEDRWVSECLAGDPRPKIYFKILEFGENGGLIKFWYAKIGNWNQLHLYASKDGVEYVELWKCPAWDSVGKTEVIVEIPPGYKYFYFHLRDGDSYVEDVILWKKIQFIVFETPTSPLPPLPSLPSAPQPPSMFTLVMICVAIVVVLVIVCVVVVVVLMVTKLKKTKSKKV